MAVKAKALDAAASVILLWNKWNLHGFVLFSLSLQMFLFFSAPLRKKSTFVLVGVSIWSAYQLVDTVIFRALALISSAQKQPEDKAEFVDLYTFWAAFLMLHFGGTDTITALAMEDNNLWARSYINLFSVSVVTVNTVLSVPRDTRLLRPLIFTSMCLILFAGLLKSVGRIVSLCLASFPVFEWSLLQSKANLGADYAAVAEELDLHKKARVPEKDDSRPLAARRINGGRSLARIGPTIKLNDAQIVSEAYRFFNKFKGTYVEMVYCCHDREESRDFFFSILPEDAFKILETEMKFAYEAFYTKMPLLSRKWYIRWLPFSLEIAALILWSLEYKKHLRSIDVTLTKSLLFGAVFIDAVAILRFYGSDWMIAHSAPNTLLRQVPWLASLLLFLRRRRWGKYPGKKKARRSVCKLLNHWSQSISQFTLRTMFRHWSESISQLNFINYCIDERSKWGELFYSFTGAKDMMDRNRYVTDVALTNDLREFIFTELKNRSALAEELDCWEEASSSRGIWILRCNPDRAAFDSWIVDVEYDEGVLIWHIATELCFEAEKEPDGDAERGFRRFSKILSDYMLYLLLRQPKLMSEMAPMAEVIFNDTTEEARQFFHEEMPASSRLPNALKCKATTDSVHKKACVTIMQVIPELAETEAASGHSFPRPSNIKEEENNSVLFDACELAKRLTREDHRSRRWEFISQMWLELLCYAASHSPGNVHAVQLAAGGELLTLVRLLMLHFGLSNQFRKAKSLARRPWVTVDKC